MLDDSANCHAAKVRPNVQIADPSLPRPSTIAHPVVQREAMTAHDLVHFFGTFSIQ